MDRRKFCQMMLIGVLSLSARPAFANKSSASIEAPAKVQKGNWVAIKVTVTHRGNSSLHYTDWLRVNVNQKEIARWDFSSAQRPEAEVFTREIKVTALEDLEVIAEANCNIHGSTGPATARITVIP